MIFPNREELKRLGFDLSEDDGAYRCTLLQGEIHRRLAERARAISGSSTRVSRAIVLIDPPSMPEGEMTAKGNLNGPQGAQSPCRFARAPVCQSRSGRNHTLGKEHRNG